MRTFKVFDLNAQGVVVRFYTMMAVVIILSLFQQYFLAALLGNILAVSFILGLSFRKREVPGAVKARREIDRYEDKSHSKAA